MDGELNRHLTVTYKATGERKMASAIRVVIPLYIFQDGWSARSCHRSTFNFHIEWSADSSNVIALVNFLHFTERVEI